MTKYELQLQHASDNGVEVIEQYEMNNSDDDSLLGLYCDNTIALSSDMQSESQKTCVLAEELGHHHTTVGNILDQTVTLNRKQELRARMWAYNRLIGISGIVKAYKAGCRSQYEVAEHLGVSEDFLQKAIDAYREKYGSSVQLADYIVMFEPYLVVMRKI